MPLFSIITPTVQRDSLIATCESIDTQTFTDWEHIVIDDSSEDRGTLRRVSRKQRIFGSCLKPHKNGGNTCRHEAWLLATGVWVYYLDDDNRLGSPRVLEDLASCLQDVGEQWALFPILRHNSIFFFDPPRPCFFDTGNCVARREIAQWPNIDDYASDAVWLTDTLLKHPYKAFPDVNPIMIMPTTSFGAGGGINGQ